MKIIMDFYNWQFCLLDTLSTCINGIQNTPTLKTPYATKPVKLQARKSKFRPITLKEMKTLHFTRKLALLLNYMLNSLASYNINWIAALDNSVYLNMSFSTVRNKAKGYLFIPEQDSDFKTIYLCILKSDKNSMSKIWIILPFSLPVCVDLWIKRDGPCCKIDPAYNSNNSDQWDVPYHRHPDK